AGFDSTCVINFEKRRMVGVSCVRPKQKVMSLSVSPSRARREPPMESFIHLRKGKTPHRLHADLDGLKDDELGRGGGTGRPANIYRRRDPTANRSVGPLRPIDVLAGEPKPSDATDANGDCRILLSRHHEPVPFYARHVDGDLLCFVHRGTGLAETEFGPLCYREGDWIYIPKACTWRQVPDSETTLLMIEAGDEFR